MTTILHRGERLLPNQRRRSESETRSWELGMNRLAVAVEVISGEMQGGF
jgi:hypothetical protein